MSALIEAAPGAKFALARALSGGAAPSVPGRADSALEPLGETYLGDGSPQLAAALQRRYSGLKIKALYTGNPSDGAHEHTIAYDPDTGTSHDARGTFRSTAAAFAGFGAGGNRKVTRDEAATPVQDPQADAYVQRHWGSLENGSGQFGDLELAPAPTDDDLDALLDGAPPPATWMRELDEALSTLLESVYDEHAHPRWPPGSHAPNGENISGQWMRIGERFMKGGQEWEIEHVAKGHVIAHEASGKFSQAETRVFAPTEQHDGTNTIADAKPVEIPILKAGQGASYAEQARVPVVPAGAESDHDPSITLPAGSPLSPEEWQRFGKADQLLYTALSERFGPWKSGFAKGKIPQIMKQYSQVAQSAVRSAFQDQYSSGYGKKAGDFLSLQRVFDQHPSAQARKIYQEGRELQGDIEEVNAWELYNRLHAPDVSVFHGGGGGTHNDKIVSGTGALKPGYSTSWAHSKAAGWGHSITAYSLAARHVLLASDISQPPGSSSYMGEAEFSTGDRLLLNPSIASNYAHSGLDTALAGWVNSNFSYSKGAMQPGGMVQAMIDHMQGGTTLPIPPPPPNVQFDAKGGGKPNIPEASIITQAAALAKEAGYANNDTAEEALKEVSGLDLKPGDLIEGHTIGKRYLVISSPGAPSGLSYMKLDGSNAVFNFTQTSERRKLDKHVEIPPPPEAEKLPPFDPEHWVQAGQLQALGQMNEGDKVALEGSFYEVTGQAGSQTLLKSLTTGETAHANAGAVTSALGPKPGFEEAYKPQVGDKAINKLNQVVDVLNVSDDGEKAEVSFAGGKPYTTAAGALIPGPELPQLKPSKGDTFSSGGVKFTVTNVMKDGTIKAKPLGGNVQSFHLSDAESASLFRPGDYEPGPKDKLGAMLPGSLINHSTGKKIEPYQVLGTSVSKTYLKNLGTGEIVALGKNQSWPSLLNKADTPKPGHESWKPGDEVDVNSLQPGDKFKWGPSGKELTFLGTGTTENGQPAWKVQHPDGHTTDVLASMVDDIPPIYLGKAEAPGAPPTPVAAPGKPLDAVEQGGFLPYKWHKGGGGQVYPKLSTLKEGDHFHDKNGKLWKVTEAGKTPTITDGQHLYTAPGTSHVKEAEGSLATPTVSAPTPPPGPALTPNDGKSLQALNLQPGDEFTYANENWTVDTLGSGGTLTAHSDDSGATKAFHSFAVPTHYQTAGPGQPPSALKAAAEAWMEGEGYGPYSIKQIHDLAVTHHGKGQDWPDAYTEALVNMKGYEGVSSLSKALKGEPSVEQKLGPATAQMLQDYAAGKPGTFGQWSIKKTTENGTALYYQGKPVAWMAYNGAHYTTQADLPAAQKVILNQIESDHPGYHSVPQTVLSAIPLVEPEKGLPAGVINGPSQSTLPAGMVKNDIPLSSLPVGTVYAKPNNAVPGAWFVKKTDGTWEQEPALFTPPYIWKGDESAAPSVSKPTGAGTTPGLGVHPAMSVVKGHHMKIKTDGKGAEYVVLETPKPGDPTLNLQVLKKSGELGQVYPAWKHYNKNILITKEPPAPAELTPNEDEKSIGDLDLQKGDLVQDGPNKFKILSTTNFNVQAENLDTGMSSTMHKGFVPTGFQKLSAPTTTPEQQHDGDGFWLAPGDPVSVYGTPGFTYQGPDPAEPSKALISDPNDPGGPPMQVNTANLAKGVPEAPPEPPTAPIPSSAPKTMGDLNVGDKYEIADYPWEVVGKDAQNVTVKTTDGSGYQTTMPLDQPFMTPPTMLYKAPPASAAGTPGSPPTMADMPIQPYLWHKSGSKSYPALSTLQPGEQFTDKNGVKGTVYKHNPKKLEDAVATTTVQMPDGGMVDIPQQFVNAKGKLNQTHVNKLSTPVPTPPPSAPEVPTAPAPGEPKITTWAALHVGDNITIGETGYPTHKITADLGDQWEVTHPPTGNISKVNKDAASEVKLFAPDQIDAETHKSNAMNAANDFLDSIGHGWEDTKALHNEAEDNFNSKKYPSGWSPAAKWAQSYADAYVDTHGEDAHSIESGNELFQAVKDSVTTGTPGWTAKKASKQPGEMTGEEADDALSTAMAKGYVLPGDAHGWIVSKNPGGTYGATAPDGTSHSGLNSGQVYDWMTKATDPASKKTWADLRIGDIVKSGSGSFKLTADHGDHWEVTSTKDGSHTDIAKASSLGFEVTGHEHVEPNAASIASSFLKGLGVGKWAGPNWSLSNINGNKVWTYDVGGGDKIAVGYMDPQGGVHLTPTTFKSEINDVVNAIKAQHPDYITAPSHQDLTQDSGFGAVPIKPSEMGVGDVFKNPEGNQFQVVAKNPDGTLNFTKLSGAGGATEGVLHPDTPMTYTLVSKGQGPFLPQASAIPKSQDNAHYTAMADAEAWLQTHDVSLQTANWVHGQALQYKQNNPSASWGDAYKATTPPLATNADTQGLKDAVDLNQVPDEPIIEKTPPAAPKPAADDLPDYTGTNLTPIGSAGGTTGAQLATDATGKQWLIKSYGGDENRVATELLANSVYRSLGVKVADAGTLEQNGKTKLAYPLAEGSPTNFSTKTVPGGDKNKMRALGDNYMTDALLANYDFVGLDDDNVLWNGDVPTRIDQGGTFEYRAQGQAKPFGNVPTEVGTMLAKGQGKRGVLTNEASMRKQATQIADTLTPEKIDQLVDAAPFADQKMRERYRTALKARVEWMREFGDGQHSDMLAGVKLETPSVGSPPTPQAAAPTPQAPTPTTGDSAFDALAVGDHFDSAGGRWKKTGPNSATLVTKTDPQQMATVGEDVNFGWKGSTITPAPPPKPTWTPEPTGTPSAPHVEDMPINPYLWHKGGGGQTYKTLASLKPGAEFSDKDGSKFRVTSSAGGVTVADKLGSPGTTIQIPHSFIAKSGKIHPTRVSVG